MSARFDIRRATEGDGEALSGVIARIAAERIHSAIDVAFTPEEERGYLRSLSDREAVLLAETDSNGVVGFQSFDLYARHIHSMRHVGQLGTFVLPEWRGRGIGRALFAATVAFARDAGYLKVVIQVRGSNGAAQSFYTSLGFRLCGRLARQVIIDGADDDELLMEVFL